MGHPVDRCEAVQARKVMKTGKSTVPSDVSLKQIANGGKVGIQIMAEIQQSSRWTENAS